MDPYHIEGFRGISHENHCRLGSRTELYVPASYQRETGSIEGTQVFMNATKKRKPREEEEPVKWLDEKIL